MFLWYHKTFICLSLDLEANNRVNLQKNPFYFMNEKMIYQQITQFLAFKFVVINLH